MLSRIDSGRPAMIAECPDCAQAKGVVEVSVGHGHEPRCAQWCVLSIAARASCAVFPHTLQCFQGIEYCIVATTSLMCNQCCRTCIEFHTTGTARGTAPERQSPCAPATVRSTRRPRRQSGRSPSSANRPGCSRFLAEKSLIRSSSMLGCPSSAVKAAI